MDVKKIQVPNRCKNILGVKGEENNLGVQKM